jgi:hypothetical protein
MSHDKKMRQTALGYENENHNSIRKRILKTIRHLEEMIKQECKRRKTDFSSFMRAAALGAMRNRTYRGGDVTS